MWLSAQTRKSRSQEVKQFGQCLSQVVAELSTDEGPGSGAAVCSHGTQRAFGHVWPQGWWERAARVPVGQDPLGPAALQKQLRERVGLESAHLRVPGVWLEAMSASPNAHQRRPA